jgi:hypothetical protein
VHSYREPQGNKINKSSIYISHQASRSHCKQQEIQLQQKPQHKLSPRTGKCNDFWTHPLLFYISPNRSLVYRNNVGRCCWVIPHNLPRCERGISLFIFFVELGTSYTPISHDPIASNKKFSSNKNHNKLSPRTGM